MVICATEIGPEYYLVEKIYAHYYVTKSIKVFAPDRKTAESIARNLWKKRV